MAKRHVSRLTFLLTPPRVRTLSTVSVVQEHDVVLLRQQGPKSPRWHLTAPLRCGSQIKLSYGRTVKVDHLLGRRPLDRVVDSAGLPVVVHEPTLSCYVLHSSFTRLATPIYPHDAGTIVSLLDIHPVRPGEEEEDDDGDSVGPPLEVFEAGTGVGSLTLHLARALHAANPPLPPTLRRALCAAHACRDPETVSADLGPEDQAALDVYKASRRLVLHTLDQSVSRAKAAFKFVRHFRRALYLPTIDFHVGTVDSYISQRLVASEGRPFLSRAVLDLASPEESAAPVVQALHPGAVLIIFQPSISQIANFQAWCRETSQPLQLDKVLELPATTVMHGLNDNGGGRPWTVKMGTVKADGGKAVQIMRPKVGGSMAGGGFVAVFRRWPVDGMSVLAPEEADESESPAESEREKEPNQAQMGIPQAQKDNQQNETKYPQQAQKDEQDETKPQQAQTDDGIEVSKS
ncbi:hypothetical protein L249_1181 [Ophiocordyceps polyrhachis-furcata BCC 54312]|uniref:tRNA (adenine(58)-N(1))-methyltransferase catalytic subunit TRM61 n=1 Tax=Ophiocordyceps polyrhachis-furcata BCC 54312 TaxID=1330021 RepID=A0A367LDM0_9HYPO|nr:hypothetical protein L249_1181 [Ophiocordyceps polyrhachis-furcata BCC 54312]